MPIWIGVQVLWLKIIERYAYKGNWQTPFFLLLNTNYFFKNHVHPMKKISLSEETRHKDAFLDARQWHWPCKTSQFRLIMDVLAPFNTDCFILCHSFPWEQLDKSGCWQFASCLLFAVRQRWETAEEKHTSYRRWPGFGSSCERKPNYNLSVLECFLLAANKSIYRPNSILFCPCFFFLYR